MTKKEGSPKKPADQPAADIVSFVLRKRMISIFLYREECLFPQPIPFDAPPLFSTKERTLVFPYKDGTKLNFELPSKLEAGTRVNFSIDPIGGGLEMWHYSNIAKEIGDSQNKGFFILKEDVDPTISLKFKLNYPDPSLPVEIHLKDDN